MLLFQQSTLLKPGIWVIILYYLEIYIASSKFSTELRDAFLFISLMNLSVKGTAEKTHALTAPVKSLLQKLWLNTAVSCSTWSQRSVLWHGTWAVSPQQSGLSQNAISPLYMQGTIHLGCHVLSHPKRHPRLSTANRERVTSFLETCLRWTMFHSEQERVSIYSIEAIGD